MGSVSRPLEQLMFSESPRRKSRTSRIIHELLDTPPDLSHTVETKKPDNACSVQAPAAKKKRMTGETNSNTHHAKVCRQQQDPPHEQVDKPVQQSLLRTPNARGHAIWFLQTPVEEIDRIDRIDVGAAVKISRLSKEEETAMNAALETVPSSEVPRRATTKLCNYCVTIDLHLLTPMVTQSSKVQYYSTNTGVYMMCH